MDAKELVRRMEVFVGSRKREEDGIERHVTLEQLCDRDGTAHANNHGADAVRRLQSAIRRRERKVIGVDVRGPCAVILERDRQTRARWHMRLEVPRDLGLHVTGILIWYEPTRDLGMRVVRNDGLLARSLIAAPHPVDLECWSRPLPLERRVARLAESSGRTDLREVRLLVVG